jgi:transposase-like protein
MQCSKSFPKQWYSFASSIFKEAFWQRKKPADKAAVAADLKEVLNPNNEQDKPQDGITRFHQFAAKWQSKYPSFQQYKKPRYALYFNYLGFKKVIRRMIYTNNWIERLNKNYKRTLRMHSALPSPEAVLFLIGSTAMDRPEYSYPVYQFSQSKKLNFN